MTCIVGLVENGKVYLGGDSAGVSGLDLTVRSDVKVFKNGHFVIGFTSSFRMGQILQYAFSPPKHYADTDTMAYMVTSFVDAVREALKSGGYARKSNDEESAGTFLVGYQGRLFRLASLIHLSILARRSAHCRQAIGYPQFSFKYPKM